MASPLTAFQTAMYTKLSGLGYSVYDFRPLEKPFPYIIIGDDNISSSMTKTASHYTILATVDVFSKYEGNKEVKQMLDAIINNVTPTMSVTGWKITHAEVINSDIMLDTLPDVIHGVVAIELEIIKT